MCRRAESDARISTSSSRQLQLPFATAFHHLPLFVVFSFASQRLNTLSDLPHRRRDSCHPFVQTGAPAIRLSLSQVFLVLPCRSICFLTSSRLRTIFRGSFDIVVRVAKTTKATSQYAAPHTPGPEPDLAHLRCSSPATSPGQYHLNVSSKASPLRTEFPIQ